MNSKTTILALLGATAFNLSAQVAYQGRLTNDHGNPLPNATRSITFKLFENPTGGSSPWSETLQVTTVDGRFSTTLGLLDSSINNEIQTKTYLELQVGSDAPLSPRQQILANPRSLHSLHADTATTATSATNATNAANATNAGNATTAGSATTLTGNIWNSPATARVEVGGSAKVFIGNPAFGNTTMEVKAGHVFVDRDFGFFSSPSGSTAIDAGFDTTSDRAIQFYAEGAARVEVVDDRLRPISNGALFLGDTTHRWVRLYAQDASIHTSDARLKTDIHDLDYGLEEILQIRPTSYRWKNKPEGPTKIGVIAQEIQKIIPEVVDVGDDEDQTLGVAYTDLIPVLINGMQEQQQQIGELKNNNQALEERVKALEQKLTTLVSALEVQEDPTPKTVSLK